MRNIHVLAAIGLLLAMLLSIAVPRALAAAPLRGTINIDGSSTVFPITDAIAEEFFKVARRVKVPVGVSGTGGGFKRFVRGETDISNASRPIKKDEHEAATSNGIAYVELPVAYDGLTIAIHPENTWAVNMTVDELKKIYRADRAVTTWSEVRNGWPDEPIRIFAPGTDSGTFDYFKEVIAGKDGSIRADIQVSEDDNILVRGVANEKYSIGFFGVAYYFANRDKLVSVAIDNGEGPVKPNEQTIASGQYAPFSRPLLVYVNAESLERPEVEAFVRFYIERATEIIGDVGYVALPDELYSRVLLNIEKRRIGTQFLDENGDHKHGPLIEIYQ